MTGRVLVSAGDTARPPHTHVVWSLGDGREMRFVDARRFGWVTTTRIGRERRSEELAVIGIEPLGDDLTAPRLGELLKSRRRPLKSFLLDQSLVAGLGNIYVSEALFLAELHPTPAAIGSRARVSRRCARPSWTSSAAPSPTAAPPCATTWTAPDAAAATSSACTSTVAKENPV